MAGSAFRNTGPSPDDVARAARAISEGGIVAYPTEAVFGLGCQPLNPKAVHRLLALKQRPMHMGLILIAADFGQLQPFLAPVAEETLQRALDTWPGPITWLIPAHPEVPVYLRGDHQTLAVRVTAHPVAVALCLETGGPLVSTSANPSGKPPARTLRAVKDYFADAVDYYVDGPVDAKASPTEIRDLQTGQIIRASSSTEI